MNNYKKFVFSIFIILYFYNSILTAENIKITITQINEHVHEVSVIFPIKKNDFIYKDFLTFSIAHPDVHISPWKTHSPIFIYYDPLFKGTKEIFKRNLHVTFTITTDAIILIPLYLYCTYYQRSEKKIKQFIHPLVCTYTHEITNNNSIKTNIDTNTYQEKNKPIHIQPFNMYVTHFFVIIKNYINSYTMSLGIHIMCILCLILLCFFSYLLQKNIFLNIQFHEDFMYIMITSCFILLLYIMHLLYSFIPSYIMLPLITFIIFSYGIFSIKKSTKIKLKYLRAFCNLCGGLCIIATIPLVFKGIQLILFYLT